MLSCSCDFDGDWHWSPDEYFSQLRTKRGRRCPCGCLMKPGATVLRCMVWRDPRCEYEENRFGDEVYMSDKFLCERCGEIYMNLSATGLCIYWGNMKETLREYWEMTGFNPEKYNNSKNIQAKLTEVI